MPWLGRTSWAEAGLVPARRLGSRSRSLPGWPGVIPAPRRPRGLVLVPTRELASQVHAVLLPLAQAMDLTVATVFGGTGQNAQVAALRQRVDIIVACPGRLADLIEQGHCHLGDVEISVLDEADHMADLGFLPVVRRLLADTPRGGQRMLFSATLDNAVDVLVRRFLNNPAVHSVDPATVAPGVIVHHLLTVTPGERVGVVATLAGGNNRSLVFTRTKHGAQKLTLRLARTGISVVELHGNLRQGARERNLASFASGAARVLVATDIAARGIHVDGIDLVIHADPPAEHKAYLHRSGRTARAGADGVVVTVQSPAQSGDVRVLMRRAGVSPQAASVSPGSALLRSIAGPGHPGRTGAAALRHRGDAGGQPGHRPRCSGHVRGYRGRGKTVNMARRDSLARMPERQGRWNTPATARRLSKKLLSTFCDREGARIFSTVGVLPSGCAFVPPAAGTNG